MKTETEVKHTPTPCKTMEDVLAGYEDWEIVRAVNAHDELVAAVKVFLSDFKKSSGFDEGLASEQSEKVIAMAETLLAKAEGR